MTTRGRVLLTHRVHAEVLADLERDFAVVPNPSGETWPRARVLDLASGCDAMMAFMPDRVDDAFLAACPRLRIVAAALKGSDNFDVDAFHRRGVWLTRVSDLLTVPTAELAIGLLIGVTRHVLAGDDHVRSGRFAGWRPELYGIGLAGATLGILGLGAVGRAVAERLVPFGVRVVYSDPHRAPSAWSDRVAVERVGVDVLLARSDFVMPLVHLTPETRHLIDAAAIGRMRRGAVLVNVGRGSVVDEAAVADALAAGHLAGYAADVFEMEDWALESRPRAIEPRLLADRERTLFTPHLGSAVDAARRAIALEAAAAIRDAFEGRVPRGAIAGPGLEPQ